MKKYLSILFVAVFALVLTGCGKGNTLTCTNEEDGVKSKTVITFKGEKVTKIVTSGEYKTKEDANEAYSWLALASAFGGEEAGLKATMSGKTVTITMTGAALEESDEFEGNKEEVKKALEKEGYKCK